MALVKMSVNLPEEVMEDLRKIAEERQVTLTQAIRDGIAMEKYLTQEQLHGGRVLIQKPDQTLREVEFVR